LSGGFGNINTGFMFYIVQYFKHINELNKRTILESLNNPQTSLKIKELQGYGPYLAGLIEGDGTFAIRDPNNLEVSHYNPYIIVAFKVADLPLAQHLCTITGCGTVRVFKDRNYVL